MRPGFGREGPSSASAGTHDAATAAAQSATVLVFMTCCLVCWGFSCAGRAGGSAKGEKGEKGGVRGGGSTTPRSLPIP